MTFDRVAHLDRVRKLGHVARWGDQTERFWALVDRGAACWERRGKERVGIGYGRVFFDGRRQLAHRVSWQIAHGPIAPGLVVCHQCDNPRCVRPEHLFLGTLKDNAQDAKRKGRLVHKRGLEHWTATNPERITRGSAQPRAKLYESKVKEIRARVASGESGRSVARDVGISSTAVFAIINRKLWGHV